MFLGVVKIMAKSKCTPLKVTAYLVDGRFSSSDGVIMLDSILYHGWFIKHHPEVFDDSYEWRDIGNIGLPLRQLPDNRWAASKGIYEEIEVKVEHYNKRPDFFAGDKYHYLSQDKGEISDSMGIYRAYRNPQLIRTVKDSKITFWCIGHKNEVQELLNLMIGVGKKTAMGFGIVSRWEVEDCEEDYTTEHPEYGLMRPIEVEKPDKVYNCPVMQYAIRPPYWKQKNMRLCYVPIR